MTERAVGQLSIIRCRTGAGGLHLQAQAMRVACVQRHFHGRGSNSYPGITSAKTDVSNEAVRLCIGWTDGDGVCGISDAPVARAAAQHSLVRLAWSSQSARPRSFMSLGNKSAESCGLASGDFPHYLF